MQGDVCVEEASVALAKSIDLVKETMTNEQKEVSRCVAPHVQAQLVDGYDQAMLERGIGSVARQKVSIAIAIAIQFINGMKLITRHLQALFRTYLQDCKDDIFDDGATVVLDRLTAAAEAIGETLDNAMGNLAQKVCSSLCSMVSCSLKLDTDRG